MKYLKFISLIVLLNLFMILIFTYDEGAIDSIFILIICPLLMIGIFLLYHSIIFDSSFIEENIKEDKPKGEIKERTFIKFKE